MSWRGIFSGALALIALQAVLGTEESAERVGGGFSWIADLARAALDPSVAAIPDLAGVGEVPPPASNQSSYWSTRPTAPEQP